MADNSINVTLEARFDDFTKKSDKVTRSMGKNKNAGDSAHKAYKNLSGSLGNASKKFQNLNRDINRGNSALNGLTKTFGRFTSMISTYAIAKAFAVSINSALEMIETTNLFNVSLADMATETDKVVVSMSKLSGMDYTNLQNVVATYSLLGRSMGMSSEMASELGIKMSQLALDYSSLMNVPIEQVMGDLKSGLVGQSETVYKYGVDVTEAGIKQQALAQGITESVRSMTQGEKMLLRANVMLNTSMRTGTAGDFARTIEQPANQLRILKERLVTASRALGTAFLPILARVLPYLNAFVSLLTDAFMALARLFGYDAETYGTIKDIENVFSGTEDGAIGVDEALDGASKSAEKYKKSLQGFDQLNIIQAPTTSNSSGSGGSVGGASGLLDYASLTDYDNMFDTLSSRADEIKKKMKPFFDGFIEFVKLVGIGLASWKIMKIVTSASKLIPIFLSIKEIGKAIATFGLFPALKTWLPKASVFAGVFGILTGIYLMFKGINDSAENGKITIGTFITMVGGLASIVAGVALVTGSMFAGVLVGIGALTGGLALLGAKFQDRKEIEIYGETLEDLSKSATNLKESTDDLIDSSKKLVKDAGEAEARMAEDLTDRYYKLAKKTNLTSGEKLVLKEISDDLVKIIPELEDAIDKETGVIKLQKEEVYKLIDSLKEQAKTEAMKKIMIELYEKQYEAQKELTKQTEAYEQALIEQRNGSTDASFALINLGKNIDSADSSLQSINGEIQLASQYLYGTQTTVNNLDYSPIATKLNEASSSAIFTASQLGVNLGNAIYNGLKNAMNGAFAYNNPLQAIISQMATDLNQRSLNFGITTVDPVTGRIKANSSVGILRPRLTWNEKGGIFDGASVIGVGENGAEAVMPLEKNTGWISQLAEDISVRGGGMNSDGIKKAFKEALKETNLGDTVLYIGTEEIARASNKGNQLINRRYNPVLG